MTLSKSFLAAKSNKLLTGPVSIVFLQARFPLRTILRMYPELDEEPCLEEAAELASQDN